MVSLWQEEQLKRRIAAEVAHGSHGSPPPLEYVSSCTPIRYFAFGFSLFCFISFVSSPWIFLGRQGETVCVESMWGLLLPRYKIKLMMLFSFPRQREVDYMIKKSEGTRNTRYVDTRLDEVYPSLKPTSRLNLRTVKSKSKVIELLDFSCFTL